MADDSPPLFFRKAFGSLRPANPAAEAAMAAIEGPVRVRITKATANQRRRGFYWVMLDVAAEVITDRTDTPWDAQTLHHELKVRLRLGTELRTVSGERSFKVASTSDRSMTEPERARWTDRCANVLSHWTGVPVADLMNEARARDAA